ncbi:hypothetical protein BU17DRAFT_97877 [Hysterangium stoloniferum]|nr:hypothetical protein BU17DRAFT_97877 [Hysterangium stoloniferum]
MRLRTLLPSVHTYVYWATSSIAAILSMLQIHSPVASWPSFPLANAEMPHATSTSFSPLLPLCPGVFEVSLVQVNKDRRTDEVLWDRGQKGEFKWGSIVWSWSGETGRKPTAEEIATKLVRSKPTPKHVASTSSTVRCRPPGTLSAPIYDTYPAELFSLQTQLFEQQQQLGREQGQGWGGISPPPVVQQTVSNTNG